MTAKHHWFILRRVEQETTFWNWTSCITTNSFVWRFRPWIRCWSCWLWLWWVCQCCQDSGLSHPMIQVYHTTKRNTKLQQLSLCRPPHTCCMCISLRIYTMVAIITVMYAANQCHFNFVCDSQVYVPSEMAVPFGLYLVTIHSIIITTVELSNTVSVKTACRSTADHQLAKLQQNICKEFPCTALRECDATRPAGKLSSLAMHSPI